MGNRFGSVSPLTEWLLKCNEEESLERQSVYLTGDEGSHMEITTKKEAGKGIIVSVRGRIDSASTTELEKVLAESMGRGEKVFVIDLSEVNYISSAGLRSILIINKN